VNGNVVPGYRGTVHFTSSDTQAGLPSNYTFTAADNGVHTFTVTLITAGDQTVTVTDTATGSITGSASVSVQAGAAVGFYIAAPSSAGSGTAFDVTVYAVDPYYNVDTNYQGTITWTSTDGDSGVVLPADYQFQPTDQGQVTFPGGVTLITSGDQFITVTDTSDSTITGSADVTVTTPGPVPHGSRPNFVALTISPLTDAQGSTLTGSVPSPTAHGTASNLEDRGIDRVFATAGSDAGLLRSGQETMTALRLALEASRATPSWEVLAAGLPLDQLVS
jgi:hypothetical protein